MRKRRGIKLIRQRKDYDCGVACLSMLLDIPYGEVAHKWKGWSEHPTRGIELWQMEKFGAKELGVTFRKKYRGKGYLEGVTGILGLVSDVNVDHWVVLQNGDTILDPDSERVWELADYLERYKYRTGCVLEIVHDR